MKVRIDIDTKTFIRFWLVMIGFALAAIAVWNAQTALIIIGISLFLSIALSKPVGKLASLLPGNSRLGGTALAYISVVVVLGGFIFLVVPPIVEQTGRFVQTIPSTVDEATQRWGGIDGLVDQYGVRDQVDEAISTVRSNAAKWASNIGSTLLTGASSLVSFGVALLITLVMTFFMLLEGPAWMKQLWSIYADKKRMKHHRELADKMYKIVSSYVNGQLIIALIAGSAAALVIFVLSLFLNLPTNLAAPVAAIVFVGSLIPMFGATIAGIIVTILLLFNDTTAAIIFLVYFLVYVQVENNLITTVIQSKTLNLSPLVVLIAVTIGTYLIGIAGGIISIPIAGCIRILLEDWQRTAKAKRKQSDKPLVRFMRKVKESSDEV